MMLLDLVLNVFMVAIPFALVWAWKIVHEFRKELADLRYELRYELGKHRETRPLEQLPAPPAAPEVRGDGVGLSSGMPVAIRGQR